MVVRRRLTNCGLPTVSLRDESPSQEYGGVIVDRPWHHLRPEPDNPEAARASRERQKQTESDPVPYRERGSMWTHGGA